MRSNGYRSPTRQHTTLALWISIPESGPRLSLIKEHHAKQQSDSLPSVSVAAPPLALVHQSCTMHDNEPAFGGTQRPFTWIERQYSARGSDIDPQPCLSWWPFDGDCCSRAAAGLMQVEPEATTAKLAFPEPICRSIAGCSETCKSDPRSRWSVARMNRPRSLILVDESRHKIWATAAVAEFRIRLSRGPNSIRRDFWIPASVHGKVE